MHYLEKETYHSLLNRRASEVRNDVSVFKSALDFLFVGRHKATTHKQKIHNMKTNAICRQAFKLGGHSNVEESMRKFSALF